MQLATPFVVPVLEAGELHLSGYRASDAEWVARLAGPLDVARYTGLPHPMDSKAAKDWVDGFLEGQESGTKLGWVARLGGDPIGAGSLRLNQEQGIARLGFWLAQDHWGRGHGRTIAQALTDFAFDVLGARRLEADCVAENVGSTRILRSCGFQEEGRLRGGFHRFGATCDAIVFGALRSERQGSA